MKTRGAFFSFDGVDGAGKSTQRDLFCQFLAERGQQVITCRDPGSTPLGERLRDLLLHRDDCPIHRRSEMLLYMAARAQLVEDVIRPALAAGKTVVSDRFLLANLVYQGYAGGLPLDDVRTVGRIATGELLPDLTFLLDLDAEAALARIRRPHDRMESQGLDFARRVRQGFLAEAAAHPEAIVVCDAARSIHEIQQRIQLAATPFLS